MEKNEREIDRSIIALERSFAFRQKLDTMLAHDLRGPFHGLVGLSKVIASPNTPEKDMRSYAILLERETGKFLDLLNDLLRWTQRQISERNVEHQQFTPAEIFQYLERYFRADILGKSLTFRYEIMENFRIHGDWQLSTAIMRNFLSNAVKFSSPGADIAFRAVKTGNKAILAIADEGADDLEGLFFNASAAEENVPAPIKQGEKGFGMGLQLCRDFARRLNGKISVVSGIGQGTELWFITPLDQRGDKAK
ncbi:MAG: HAMP domain-containing histidine kinase, partial [Leptospiraceae bacterium]|nr:HAMP domain-containing histidine kinase [Leptospiraceae bacterium]